MLNRMIITVPIVLAVCVHWELIPIRDLLNLWLSTH